MSSTCCCFPSEFKRRTRTCKHPSCLQPQFCFVFLDTKRSESCEHPFVFHFVFGLVEKRKQKWQTSFTKTECLYTFCKELKHVIPPYLVWKQRNFNATTYYLREALFDGVFDLVLVYCFFRHYKLPYYRG
jgi:hypothetical protein